MKAGSDIHRDSAQLRNGVGLCEGELAIVGVDERDVERIVLRRGVGRRKRPGNWRTTQVQKRSAVMLDTVAVGVTICENRRPAVRRDTVDGRIGCVSVITVVGRRRWRIRCLGRIWGLRVWECWWCVFATWRLGRRGRSIILTRNLGWCGCRIFFTREFGWRSSFVIAGQLRRRGLRWDRDAIGGKRSVSVRLV